MAIKKTQLYNSLWEGCDALRGGMDASQYKDYVLTMLFIKYISDKYAGEKDALIQIPEGASFEDMVKLKGQKDIGDKINKQIIRPIFRENGLEGEVELVDFNDDDKLGTDKEKVDLLSGLIRIFENPALNFKNNRAEDDDILGDAYEFLMRHFATESGKSKGQFYTPAEVSRVLAQIIEVEKAETSNFSVYDPTCGSGSLLLKVALETDIHLSLYGQEKDNSVKSLAVMNMWMHGYEDAIIKKGNTIARPEHKENDGSLKRFDRVVANPPFSMKNWSQGINPWKDEHQRFLHYGVPPEKNGDYAYLLHIVASLKSTGKAAVILPHGVLFRGNAEAEIRKNLIARKYIKGIIGLPANLFYGTGIPACILVIDKEEAEHREGIFMIDASKGFIKDGNKNRLREQDIHKIVDIFNARRTLDRYSRFVTFEEIEKNEHNLNIPRYIDVQEDDDRQDLNAHIHGGIPHYDINKMDEYWQVYPNIRQELFTELRSGYSQLSTDATEIKDLIFNHQEFKQYRTTMEQLFEDWKSETIPVLKDINIKTSPKKLIYQISETLLAIYTGKALVNRYDMYQHLMDYWLGIMKDDTYIIIEDGWKAKLHVVKETRKEKVYDCDLVPKTLVVDRYFAVDRDAIQQLEADKEMSENELTTLLEEHTGEEAIFEEVENNKVNRWELIQKQVEYENLAFARYFNALYLNYQHTYNELDAVIADIRDMLGGELWGSWFEPLANARGHLVKGNVQKRVLRLKQQIETSDLPDAYKQKTQPINKTNFEKLDWEKHIQHPWFEELDVLHDYLSQIARLAALKKETKELREDLRSRLDGIMTNEGEYLSELRTIRTMLFLTEEISSLGMQIQNARTQLEEKTINKYGELSEEEVRTLVVDDKWMPTLSTNIHAEIDKISQRLTGRIKELAGRYATTLTELDNEVKVYEEKATQHLLKMGVLWS